MNRLAVAAIAVALVALAWWYSRRTAGGAKYKEDSTSHLWSPDASGVYTCAGSSSPSYCILPTEAAAVAQCNSDAKCLGYSYYSDDPAFGYQLFTQPPSVAHYPSTINMIKS